MKKKKNASVEPVKKIKAVPPPNACSHRRKPMPSIVPDDNKLKSAFWKRRSPPPQTLWYYCDRCIAKGRKPKRK